MRKTLIIILSIIGVILLVCLGLFIYVKVTYLSKDDTNNPSANNSQNITLDEAKNIALKDAKLNTSDVVFTEAKQELDDGKTVYDIEFYHDYNEYNYEIDATNGTIISFDKDYR